MSAQHRSIWNERLDALCHEYESWCRAQGLPHQDAYEQLQGPVSEQQRAWLVDFCERWEKIWG